MTNAAFAAGTLSYSKVRAITRVATAENEQDFVYVGTYATASQMETLTRAYRQVRKDPELAALDVVQQLEIRERDRAPFGVRYHALVGVGLGNDVQRRRELAGTHDEARAARALASDLHDLPAWGCPRGRRNRVWPDVGRLQAHVCLADAHV